MQDASGAVIPGAQIVVATQEGKAVARGTTDGTGNFFFLGVAAGSYIVDVKKDGFKEIKQTTRIDSSNRPPMRIVMRVAAVNQELQVSASDSSAQVSTEIAQNQSGNTIDRNALDRLPVFDQDYITTMSRFLDADATGTNGVTLVVNGVEANGPGVTASAIQSVKINQNPYTALYSRPGRARIEITTKGGTPELHGSGNFLYRDSLFDATNAFAATKPSEQRTYFEGSLTGALSHSKKTTFLLSLDKDNDNQQAIVLAAGPDGPINANVPNPTHHYFISGRVFHDYGQGNQFWIGYSYEHRMVANQGVGGTVLPEAGTNTLFFEHEINVGHLYVISPKVLNQLHFLVGHYDSQVHDLNENPQLIVSGAFTGGGAQANSRRTEYHFDGTDIVTYTSGKQEIKFGVDVPDISRRGFDDFTNQVGTYSFASLADYTAAQPFSYLFQSGQGHVTFLEKTVAGIVEDTIRLRSNLSIAAGVRYYWQNYFHDIAHNFAPRLSFAYAPTAKGGTVVRGGAGFFFDRTGPSPISDLLHFNGVLLKRFLVDSPSYPITPPELAGVPTSVVVLDPRQRIPYTIQYGIGIEQQLNERSSIFVNYIGARGIDLFRSVDVNAPRPPIYAARPNPNLGQERQLQSEGYQKSNALEVGFRGRPVSFFTGQVRYNLGKTYNNTGGITYFPANSYFPNADWSRSDNDQRHKFDMLGAFEAGKWFTFGTALSAYSGKPVNITTGNDDFNSGMANARPAGVPRNSFHGPAYLDLDLNLSHDFLLTKAGNKGPVASLSMNSFNVLNHANDMTYIGVIGSPFFGHAVAAQPPRRMQLDLQLKF
ncbi:MAG: carboxypeptidase regulatory-like domain-containing protein [Acidobacteriales bacterium]|nr:carboxypeptidase regulatory-like domain-containing protein [Terriglobales bacterium]